MTREPASGEFWANDLAMGCDRGLVLQAILLRWQSHRKTVVPSRNAPSPTLAQAVEGHALVDVES